MKRRSLESALRAVRRNAVDAPEATSRCSFCTGPARLGLVAESPQFYVTPTLGAFVAGYVLIIPHTHVHSFGQLAAAPLAEAEALIGVMTARLTATYRMPVLAFEYGHADGRRRIAHAHWHLLPTEADLHGWLDDRLDGRALASLAELPGGSQSYIAVRDQDGRLATYLCDETDPRKRIRLRRVVADLDPRVDGRRWDWAAHPFPEIIQQTVADLAEPDPNGSAMRPASVPRQRYFGQPYPDTTSGGTHGDPAAHAEATHRSHHLGHHRR